jgi:hypothetical protein
MATVTAAWTWSGLALATIFPGQISPILADSIQPTSQSANPAPQILRPTPDASAALTPAGETIPACAAPRISIVPMRAGRAELVIDSDCRRFQSVRIRYASMEFVRTVDENGRLDFILDCIAGDAAPVEFVFADGSHVAKKLTTLDLDKVTKVAVIWSAPVNLDLHAFEYAAAPQSPGHIWRGSPSSESDAAKIIAAEKRGHGFMTVTSTGKENGTKLEVYTFWHQPGQKNGVINMALDYESRANGPRDMETCGSGLYSDLEYEAVLLDRNRPAKRFFAKFASLDCSKQLSGLDRYNHKSVPEIFIKN